MQWAKKELDINHSRCFFCSSLTLLSLDTANYCTKQATRLHLQAGLIKDCFGRVQTERGQQYESCVLPCVNIETFLGELRCDDCSPRELATGKSFDSTLCRLGILILDIDLANTEAGAGTGWAGNLSLDDGAVFLALLFDVLFDFCSFD
jgi:hypothetical protein